MRKQDVSIAKNYLSPDKMDTLNRLIVIFLEQAELHVKQKQQLTLLVQERRSPCSNSTPPVL